MQLSWVKNVDLAEENVMIHSLLVAVLSCSTVPVSATESPALIQCSAPPVKIAAKLNKEALAVRNDEPGAAAAHGALKRKVPAGGPSIAERMRAARAQSDLLPRYSTRLGGPIPSPAAQTSLLPGIPSLKNKALGRWEALGPGNIGGRSRTMLIQPDDPEIMYLGGVSGGIWKTTDGGTWWEPISDDLANIAINSMVMDPTDFQTIYAGTGEGYFREDVRGTWLPLQGDGIFKTTDGGSSWFQLPSTRNSNFEWVNDLEISSLDSRRIYAATRSGVWRSDDAGLSWSQLHSEDAHGGCLDLALRTDTATDLLFASCGTLDQGTVYRNTDASTENGTWEVVLSEAGMGRTTLAIAPSNQDIIYALAASHGGAFDMGLFAVFRSEDGGRAETWHARVRNTDYIKINRLLLTNPVAASYVYCGWSTSDVYVQMGWYCNTIAVDPVDPERVWAAGVDLFRSDDGGRNWGIGSYWWLEDGDEDFVHADQHAIIFHPDYDGVTNRTIFSASDGGIFRSLNARARVATSEQGICSPNMSSMQWTSLNHNLGITQFYHGLSYPGGDRFLGGTQDNGTITARERNGKDSWYMVFGGDGGYVAIDPVNTSNIYVEYQWSRIQKSTNGGLTFSDARNGITDSPANFLFITPFVMDPNDPNTLWMGGRKMWRTTNGTDLWSIASPFMANMGMVSAIAVAPENSNRVVAGTTNGDVYLTTEALSSGFNSPWQSSTLRSAFVSSVAFDPHDAETVWATLAEFGGPHVYRSTDLGQTWESRDGSGNLSLPDIPVHSIVIDPVLRGRIFIGTDLGVFTSSNNGHTWAVENTGFASAVTESLSIGYDHDAHPMLFAFTHGRGAWRVPISPGPPAPRLGTGRH